MSVNSLKYINNSLNPEIVFSKQIFSILKYKKNVFQCFNSYF